MRLHDVGAAGRAWLAAAWRRATGRRAAAGPAGVTLLENGGRNDGPPDLDELWRDFNRKLSGLFSGRGGAKRGNGGGDSGGGPNFQPNLKSAGVGAALIGGVIVLIWLGSGVFIVQEGQQAVVTSFGRYSHTVDAGFQWRFPYPFQAHETVSVTQLRSTEVGRNSVSQATGLRDSSMLTQDENIVDIRFTVQYRLKDARAFLFENRDPEAAVTLAAESAVREIVGKSKIDSVLYEQRDAIANDLVKSIQAQLDRLKTGVLIVNVNVQSVQPPEQVQAAFEDTLKAGQDGDRLKKEGQAYASSEIPKAQGTAARLRQEAEGYKSRVIVAGRGRCRSLRPPAHRIPEGAAGDARAPLHRHHARGLLEHHQGHDRRPQQLEPAQPAARPAAAAGGRGAGRAGDRRGGSAAGVGGAAGEQQRRRPLARKPARPRPRQPVTGSAR